METVCLDNQPMMFVSDFCPTDCAINANKRLKTNRLSCLKSGLLDSNQRPRAPQTCALPTALNPVPFCECKGTAIISIHQTIVQLFYSFDIIKHIIDITSR